MSTVGYSSLWSAPGEPEDVEVLRVLERGEILLVLERDSDDELKVLTHTGVGWVIATGVRKVL